MAKIIVVEDEAIVAMATKMMLATLSHEIISVVSMAEQALDAVNNGEADLILMDIKLKGEMDGIHAAEEIRKSKNTPILFVTGNSDAKTKLRIDKISNSSILQKPVMVEDLSHSLKLLLN
ncbi:MAG: putative sensory transduction regulatory protein [Bacteroidota bacterium]|jgi:CheY-like chemotaxis protein|nr:putative sensory transduction regulatory protein [Bacteroidota bacterium]